MLRLGVIVVCREHYNLRRRARAATRGARARIWMRMGGHGAAGGDAMFVLVDRKLARRAHGEVVMVARDNLGRAECTVDHELEGVPHH
jgi:hypothetical protein